MNKRGQGLSINTTILIIIGIVVLVVMILGFTTGWGNFKAWFSSSDNIDQIITQCSISCASDLEHDYCSTIKNLNLGYSKSAKGSCKALGDIEGFSSSCDSIKCASVNPAECKKKGGIVDCKTWAKIEEIDYESEDLSPVDLGIIRNCKIGEKKRKKELGIPNKLCYWESIMELYDEKCENFDEKDILEIFEEKSEYRELNNPDWPSLETDKDFCVNVYYDCDKWDASGKDKRVTFGFARKYKSGLRESYINPYISANPQSKQKIQDTLLHEALHNIQKDAFKENLLDDLYLNEGEHSREDEKAIEFFNEMVPHYNKIKGKFVGIEFSSLKFNEESLLQVTEKIILPSEAHDNLMSIANFLKEEGRYNLEVEDSLDEIYSLSVKAFTASQENFVRKYLINKREVDPRISIVHRWWLDQTAPNCEIIRNEAEAREVFNKFLSQNFLSFSDPAYYKVQYQIKMILEFYTDEERERIYDLFINRLPGLAKTDEVSDGTAYA